MRAASLGPALVANHGRLIMHVTSQTLGRAPRRQRGLTLIELVVVLTILIAVGGILVPVIGNALTRSHVATCATNIPEVSKMLVAANATLGTFGTNWNTGVFGAGTNADEAVNDVFGPKTGLTGEVRLLTTAEATSLDDAGIGNICDHADQTTAEFNVTFNNFSDTQCEAPADTVHVIALNAAAYQAVNLPAPTGAYIWLGIDKNWSLLGTMTPEPPVHFGDTAGALPHEVYSRFGAVFEVGNGPATFKRVTYNIEGAADSFETADNHVGIHWQEVHGTGL